MSEPLRIGLYFERGADGAEGVAVHLRTEAGWSPPRKFDTLGQAMAWFSVRVKAVVESHD